MSSIYLSVVIPCYDEMANLQKGVLDKIAHFFEKKRIAYEVIIADDGSKDGSIEFIEKFIKDNPHFALIKNPHYGKAGAVTTGMLQAKGKYRLFTDMDQATPIEEVDKLLPFLESKEYDVAIGSRKSERKGAPAIRLFISRCSIILRKYLIGMHEISDTQCGFKLFTGTATEDIFSRYKKIKHGFEKITGTAITFGSDIEILYLAKKHGYKIKEVPVEWLHVETRRVNPVTDSIQGVLDLLRIKRNIVIGVYN
ncbi:MAG TPA: glycosyltransferase [Candidatus Sulfotelmatobacter sp.]|jgi:dolichyl-phosphate beta-glucosyltransferase|nr:glycosyltransferase [Candidatus Sulfotelmatobacter sp.]